MATSDDESVLLSVGPRLRAARLSQDATLEQISDLTGISVSTLSRLESGRRKATLELLLPLARAYRVPLDDLIGAPDIGNPRIRMRPVTRHGMTYVPLTRRPGGVQAYKQLLPGRPDGSPPSQRAHEGYEWLYVLNGRLRLLLGDHDLILTPGEVVEFDTRIPHGFASADADPVEILSLFGPQGERLHLRNPRPASGQSG